MITYQQMFRLWWTSLCHGRALWGSNLFMAAVMGKSRGLTQFSLATRATKFEVSLSQINLSWLRGQGAVLGFKPWLFSVLTRLVPCVQFSVDWRQMNAPCWEQYLSQLQPSAFSSASLVFANLCAWELEHHCSSGWVGHQVFIKLYFKSWWLYSSSV